jgi:hypothetical protein
MLIVLVTYSLLATGRECYLKLTISLLQSNKYHWVPQQGIANTNHPSFFWDQEIQIVQDRTIWQSFE